MTTKQKQIIKKQFSYLMAILNKEQKRHFISYTTNPIYFRFESYTSFFITDTFRWYSTIEGGDFWSKVSKKIEIHNERTSLHSTKVRKYTVALLKEKYLESNPEFFI